MEDPMRSLLGIMLALALSGCAKTSGVIVAAQPGFAACAHLVGDSGEAITDQNGEPTGFLVKSLIAGVTTMSARSTCAIRKSACCAAMSWSPCWRCTATSISAIAARTASRTTPP
jgi:hypothetical protein